MQWLLTMSWALSCPIRIQVLKSYLTMEVCFETMSLKRQLTQMKIRAIEVGSVSA